MDYGQQAANSQRTSTQEFYERQRVEIMQRICVLEQQVANQAVEVHVLKTALWGKNANERMTSLKSQAAQQQAQGGLNDPQIGNLAHQNFEKEPAQSYGQMAQNNQQAVSGLYAPLRSDTKPLIDLAAFARRLLNPDDLGHAVTHEVRNAARRALGMPEVREYDL
jgi:hypothetical protein